MNRNLVIGAALAAIAILAGSLWVGLATATAVAFMALYAVHSWKTA